MSFTYQLSVIPAQAVQFVGTTPNYQFNTGDGWSWAYPGVTLTFDQQAVQTLAVSDTDQILQDGPPAQWYPPPPPPPEQAIGEDFTVNGVTYAAGRQVEAEYTVSLSDPDGNIYELVAISVQTDPSNPWLEATVIGFTFGNGVWPPAGVELTFVPYSQVDGQPLIDPAHPVCFAAGTMILTPRGPRPVESLQVGDLVETLDQGPQPLRWIGHVHIDGARLLVEPKLRPVRIQPGALGANMPAHAMTVSPQHRILMRNALAAEALGAEEVLVPAKSLTGLRGVTTIHPQKGVDYWHFAFDAHHLVWADGVPAESLYLGAMALESLGDVACAALFAANPHLAARVRDGISPARPLICNKPAAALAARLRQSGTPLIEAAAAPLARCA